MSETDPLASTTKRRTIRPDRYLRASPARSKQSARAGTWGAIVLSTTRSSSTPMDICRSIALSSPATPAPVVHRRERELLGRRDPLVSGSDAQPVASATKAQATAKVSTRMFRELLYIYFAGSLSVFRVVPVGSSSLAGISFVPVPGGRAYAGGHEKNQPGRDQG
jgi:hypothetical protein